MNRLPKAGLLVAALAITPLSQAQTYSESPAMGGSSGGNSRWGFEVRTGTTSTTDNYGGADLERGFGLDLQATYKLTPNLGLYSGISLDAFDANQDFTSRDNAILDLGYSAGLTLGSTFGASRVGWRLHAGANYGEVKLYESDNDHHVAATGHELGWEAGAAITIELPGSWYLSPGITYRSRPASLRLSGVDLEGDLHFYRVGIGFGRQF